MAQTLPSSLSNLNRIRYSSYVDKKVRNASKLLKDRCYLIGNYASDLREVYNENMLGIQQKNWFVVATASQAGQYVGIVVMEQFHCTRTRTQWNGNVFVKTKLRKKGIGAKLMRRAEKLILALNLGANVEVKANDDFASFAYRTFKSLPIR